MVNPERVFKIAQQTVIVDGIDADEYILDIGGGGEGVIGQLMGTKVIAIDVIPNELAHSPEGPLKIIMDGRDLKFLDATFNTVTAFFSFMFIHPDDHAQVFQEIYRVLKRMGNFLLWEVEVQQPPEPQKDIFAFSLDVKLPTTVISTGYGTPYTERPIALIDYVTLAIDSGFELIKQNRDRQTFFCMFQKP